MAEKSKKRAKTNPFKDCESIQEIGNIIRKKCEELLKEKYKVFEIKDHLVREDYVRITIEADEKVRKGWSTFPVRMSCVDIIRGLAQDNFDSNRILARWDGGAFREILAGYGGQTMNHICLSRISLEGKYVPKLVAMHKKNARTKEGYNKLLLADLAYTKEEQVLVEQVRLVTERAKKVRDDKAQEYLNKNPEYDLLTGKHTPWVR